MVLRREHQLALREFAEPFPHTDQNTLHRVV